MSVPLKSIRDSFEGVIPSIVATLDSQGMPNVSYLSQTYYVDEQHVALSNQFFSKTAANVQATGRAALIVVDGRNGDQCSLDLLYERSLADGELYEKLSAQLDAISSHHGMGAIMALRSADLYQVVASRAVPSPHERPDPDLANEGERLAAAARLAAAISEESDAETMIERTLDGLVGEFGIGHAIIFLQDAGSDQLTALASRGYDTGGTGAEVMLGKGVVGIAATTGRPVRLSEMSRGRRMAAAVSASSPGEMDRTIPLPGLAEPQSQLAAPMVSRGRPVGVLFVESGERFRFSREDEDALTLIGGQLAAGLRLAELEAQRRADTPSLGSDVERTAGPIFRVKYYAHDNSLFLDDTYLIKGLPGRLLFHFLTEFVQSGRRNFTNREVRLEPGLKLPGLKDNLETRLILLRRRLDEKAAPVRLSRPARGQIRLEIFGTPHLEVISV